MKPLTLADEAPLFTNKKAIITGGTTGIGRSIAVHLARQGCDVLIFGRHKKELNDAVKEIAKEGRDVIGIVADQAELDDVKRIFTKAKSVFKKIDFFVNNAAVSPDALEETSPEKIDYAIRANLTGYLTCTHYALKSMTRGGHIVNIGSMSAESRGAEGEIYTATKAGIRGFSESLRKTLLSQGIRVTLLEPGWTGSDLIELKDPEAQRKEQKKLAMLKADDIAECVVFSLAQPMRCDISLMQIQPLKDE